MALRGWISGEHTPTGRFCQWDFLVQISQALEHCHCLNLAHRDLKPENLLFKDNSLVGTLTSADSFSPLIRYFQHMKSLLPSCFKGHTCFVLTRPPNQLKSAKNVYFLSTRLFGFSAGRSCEAVRLWLCQNRSRRLDDSTVYSLLRSTSGRRPHPINADLHSEYENPPCLQHVFVFRYLRHKEGTRRKSLELYLPHPLLTHITRWLYRL